MQLPNLFEKVNLTKNRPSTSDLRSLAVVALMFHSTMTNGLGALDRPGPLLELHSTIPQIRDCRQLITVTTNSWNDRFATIRVFERGLDKAGFWQQVGKPFPGVIGTL